ncbi:hypothetical protein QFZ20_002281 [Flavobacterium sp. W4I14]|nr:hypothetical protein [Flavobacterium sp. W4I14]
MEYFSDGSIPEDTRRNIAFQVLVANRDLLQMASKRPQPPTYENALGLLYEVAPDIHAELTKILTRKNESELVRYFQEIAEVKTLELDREVTALEIIEQQINTYEQLLKRDPSKKLIKKRLLEAQIARQVLQPIRLTENRILNRDYNKIDRTNYANKLFENDSYTDFEVNTNDILRVRFLHPDADEHVTGADLIYEQYDLALEMVRFVFLQYKVWEDGVIYVSQAKNMADQLNKMTNILCEGNLCCSIERKWNSSRYRLPYCSGFLRPTDRLQDNNSKLMSSGYHVPLCKAVELAGEMGKIDKASIKEQSFNSKIFEELFNSNMIGSRWIPVNDLEQIYETNGIFDHDNRIKLYAQEIIDTSKL